MATKKITGLFLVALFSLTLPHRPAVGDAWFAKQDRRLALALAARQIKLYEAKVESDWETMYSMMAPHIRSKIEIDVFVANPHALGAEVVVMDKPPDEAGRGITKKGLAAKEKRFGGKKYSPQVLNYRILKFKFTAGKKFARVESEISKAYPPAISPTTYKQIEKEHWSYINGTWYVEWDLKYVAQISGAQTIKNQYLPRYIYTITAKDLSTWYVERALEFEENDVQYDLIERALLLDPYNAAELITKTGINADELMKRYIERAMKGRKAGSEHFALNMEMGYWYGVSGDLEKSYKSYRKAHLQDRQRQDPLEGMVMMAYKKGDFPKTAGHYIDLIRLSSVTGYLKTKTLGPYLVGSCEYCRKVDRVVLVSLARELVLMKRYKEALGVYSFLLENSDGWGTILAKIEKGKKVKLADALGKRLLRELSNFTYDDLSGLAAAAGLELFHPADIPGEVFPKGEGIFLESMPKLTRLSYEGLQNVWFNKAIAKVSGEKSIREADKNKKGYIAVFSKGGSMEAGFYSDSQPMRAGSKKLAEKIGEIEDGTVVYLARLSTGKHTPHDYWTKSLQDAGADISTLGRAPSSHILVFRKGGGYSRLWVGFMRISKRFKPSNLDLFSDAKGSAVMFSGMEPGDYILYKVPK
jgi:hypothetical protein